MRFVYGRESWLTREEGLRNCYLLTNGLGGFSSYTMIGANARNDHALLMSCHNRENQRFHMVTNTFDEVIRGEQRIPLSGQAHVNELESKDGFRYLNNFEVDDLPIWYYQVEGVQIEKSIVMPYARNAVAMQIIIRNRDTHSITYSVKPMLQMVPKGDVLTKEAEFELTLQSEHQLLVETDTLHLRVSSNGIIQEVEPEFIHDLYYAHDVRDGREAIGCCVIHHEILIDVQPKEEVCLSIVFDADDSVEDLVWDEEEVTQLFATERARLKAVEDLSAFSDSLAIQLAKSANQFVVNKDAIHGRTIIAGYPFFSDWGRDTMIALSGCCISIGNYEDARCILQSFMKYCEKGLMPNLFPEGSNQPLYNTVDASLLFINVLYEYYQVSKDIEFIRQAFDTCKNIIYWYKNGTDFHIKMDEDGLIQAGALYEQLTWMDVRYKDILPTPRHGKPVEINAYWYSALMIMQEFTELFGVNPIIDEEYSYLGLAEKVKTSFLDQFWLEDKGYLKDVISGTHSDVQVRCNQIWAVSCPYTMLSKEQMQRIVDWVYKKLYTPVGLRSLSIDDEEFHAAYGGSLYDRDMAYHQGTVWGFPLGGYYLAYLKAYDYNNESKEQVRKELIGIEAALREGCIGQLAEIYDGEFPAISRGCFAQAWSVGEILKVCEQLC